MVNAPPMHPSPSGAPVLVVEFDPVARAALQDVLVHAGHRVVAVADGEAAFTVLLELPACACIVVDAEVAGLSARALLDRARSYLRFHRIPVVLLGDLDGETGLVVRARLAKPVQIDALVAAVRSAIGATSSWPPRLAIKAPMSGDR